MLELIEDVYDLARFTNIPHFNLLRYLMHFTKWKFRVIKFFNVITIYNYFKWSFGTFQTWCGLISSCRKLHGWENFTSKTTLNPNISSTIWIDNLIKMNLLLSKLSLSSRFSKISVFSKFMINKLKIYICSYWHD